MTHRAICQETSLITPSLIAQSSKAGQFKLHQSMAIPSNKSELLHAINQRFEKLESALDTIPNGLENTPSMEGHAKDTRMSPADLVSYLIGWNTLVLNWLARDDSGQNVDFPHSDYKWSELGQLAQKFYQDHAYLSYHEKRKLLTDLKSRIVLDISHRSNSELYATPWHGKWTKGRMIQLNTSSPYENARLRLRRWIKSQT